MKTKSRQKLEEYQKNGNYVFHGTYDKDIKIFEPRQAYNEDKDGVKFKDGLPAIFASTGIEIAIFFAIFNHHNIDINNSSFGFSLKNNKLELRATKNKIDFWKKNKILGYVYVFEKKYFKSRGDKNTEMVCENNVMPFNIIKVKNEDILESIRLKE